MASASQSKIVIQPYRTRLRRMPPMNVDAVVISKLNLTRNLIDTLKKYCSIYKPTNYEELEFACYIALHHFIYIQEGRKQVPAKDSKLLMDRYQRLQESVYFKG